MKRLFLILLLLGCSQDSPPVTDYRTGSQGIVLGFLNPDSQVYEGSKLNLEFEVRNLGAYDLQDGYGKVVLSGYEPSAVKFSYYDPEKRYAEQALPAVIGRGPYNPEGGYEILRIEEDGPVSVQFGETYSPTIMATACYKYQTLATPTVCVFSSMQDLKEENICRPVSLDLASQGGPVSVTRVEESILTQELGFRIHIENVGGGEVFDYNALSDCPFGPEREKKDVVEVSVDLVDAGTPVCEPPDMRVRLWNGKGVIFCRLPIEQETSYTAPLEITLDYGYSSSITHKIDIIKPPGSVQ